MEKGMRLIDGVSVRDKFEDNLAYMGSEVKRILNIAPTVDVEPVVHGCWIWTITGEEDYEQYWVCSECGERTYHETNYCSDCGAKMDLEG